MFIVNLALANGALKDVDVRIPAEYAMYVVTALLITVFVPIALRVAAWCGSDGFRKDIYHPSCFFGRHDAKVRS